MTNILILYRANIMYFDNRAAHWHGKIMEKQHVASNCSTISRGHINS
jgi:hypothetical protein